MTKPTTHSDYAREEHLCFRSSNTMDETRELIELAAGLCIRADQCALQGTWSAVAELTRRLAVIASRIRQDSQRHFELGK